MSSVSGNPPMIARQGSCFDPRPLPGLTSTTRPDTESEPMTTMHRSVIPFTDDRGKLLLPDDEAHQPAPGSVMLTDGVHGTAWQRFFSDGRWHPTRGGGSKSWDELLAKRNLFLVYDAPERGSKR